MDFAKLFSLHGRIGRKEYWLTYLALSVLYGFSLLGLDRLQSSPLAVLVLPLCLAYLWASMSFTVKRLHDTGRSGWWLFKVGSASVVLWAVVVGVVVSIGVTLFGGRNSHSILQAASPMAVVAVLVVCGLLLAVLNLYCLWVIGIQPGASAANDYGLPDSGSVRKA